MISVGALTPILVCFHKLEITLRSNSNRFGDGAPQFVGMTDRESSRGPIGDDELIAEKSSLPVRSLREYETRRSTGPCEVEGPGVPYVSTRLEGSRAAFGLYNRTRR